MSVVEPGLNMNWYKTLCHVKQPW